MKLGIEVEGRLRGVPTLFMDATEFSDTAGDVGLALDAHTVSHIYISDPECTLSYTDIGARFIGYIVTLDVPHVRPEPRPTNLTIMLTLPHEYFASFNRLRPDDQVKIHSPEREVFAASARSFVATHPIEFLGDKEL